MGSTIALFVRLVISMMVVMAVMGLAAKFLRRRQGMAGPAKAHRHPSTAPGKSRAAALSVGLFGGKTRRTRPALPVQVTYRQALAKGAWVSVVEAGGKRWLVGVTETAVNLISELPGTLGPEPGPEAAQQHLDEAVDLTATGALNCAPNGTDLETGRMPVSSMGPADDRRSDNAWKLAIESLRERTVRR